MWSENQKESTDKEESEDLLPMPLLEVDKKKRKLEAEETIAERVKLNPQKRKRKNERTGLKIWTPNKLLTRLPI